MRKRKDFKAIAVAGLALIICVGVLTAPAAGLTPSEPRSFAPSLTPMRLHVQGNRLIDADGRPILLRGVNIASLEWSNHGEHMREALAHAVGVWKANLIRLPLAQDRWFGKVSGQYDGGADYRKIVDGLVDACAGSRVYIDLDLHWSDRGTWADEGGKLGQQLMPDAHSVLFWRDVATRYKNYPNVIFGLYNEPHDIPWSVWRNGGSATQRPSRREPNQPPVTYQAVGMQTLYDTVRAVGAGNVVTVSGVDWGYDLRGVLEGYPISGSNILYETHPYSFKRDWDNSFGKVSVHYAVLMGEWGGSAKDLDYGKRLMAYAKQHALNWTAWCFHPTCGPPLLKNWSFEPSAFGQFVKDSLNVPIGGD